MLAGRVEEALAGFESAIDIDPGNATALSNYGYLLTQCGALDRAH